MRIAVPRERESQPLVAAAPQTVELLIRLGYEVLAERGAGLRASFPDSLYEDVGASLVDVHSIWASDVVIAVDTPDEEQLAAMRPGATPIARFAPQQTPGSAESLAPLGVMALVMDAVPRIPRAQAMDVLSSQANIAGYRVVVEAANRFGRVFIGQVTAAGKMPPARVYVTGAGVVGLAAIGTANSMGALVPATDVRPEAVEQAESMGASPVPLPTSQGKSEDGYAKALSAEEAATANALYAEQAAKSDTIITTANIPGRTAPILLDEDAIAGMAPGSIVADMAAVNGGSCTFTVLGEVMTTANSVTITGYVDLAGHLPTQASGLYGRNTVNLPELMTPGRDGGLVVDLDDEIVRGIAVSVEGSIMWPPPPIHVSTAPARVASGSSEQELAEEAARRAVEEKRAERTGPIGLIFAIVVFTAPVLVTLAVATGYYIVLILAVVLGFHVISNVTPALHIPLIPVTNAISGTTLIGAISQIGDPYPLIAGTSFAAIVLVPVSIFGDFVVTHHTLAMFRK